MKRILAGLVTAGLLTAAVAGTAAAASAATLASCSAKGNGVHCSATTGQINHPASFAFTVTASPNQTVIVGWAVGCTAGGTFKTTSGSFTGTSPATRSMSLPSTRQGTCIASVTGGLIGSGSVHVAVSSNGTVLHQIKGFANLCVGAKSNKAVLASCTNAAAEQWSFRHGNIINGKSCMNDVNNKVVLSSCNNSASETWTHNARGEYVLKAHGGTLCLTDPNSAKRPGTQLVVAACKAAANQRWTQP